MNSGYYMATYSFWYFLCLNRDIWIFLQNVLLSIPQRFIRRLSESLNFGLVDRATKRCVFFCFWFKIFFSETIRWMKLILAYMFITLSST